MGREPIESRPARRLRAYIESLPGKERFGLKSRLYELDEMLGFDREDLVEIFGLLGTWAAGEQRKK